MSRLRPDELDERLPDDDLFVLDIRPREQFHEGHIDGSRNVPVYDAVRDGDPDALDRIADAVPADAEVVTVCKMGVVARTATSHLDEQGHDAVTLAGGMRGWRGYQRGSLLYRVRSLLWDLLG